MSRLRYTASVGLGVACAIALCSAPSAEAGRWRNNGCGSYGASSHYQQDNCGPRYQSNYGSQGSFGSHGRFAQWRANRGSHGGYARGSHGGYAQQRYNSGSHGGYATSASHQSGYGSHGGYATSTTPAASDCGCSGQSAVASDGAYAAEYSYQPAHADDQQGQYQSRGDQGERSVPPPPPSESDDSQSRSGDRGDSSNRSNNEDDRRDAQGGGNSNNTDSRQNDQLREL